MLIAILILTIFNIGLSILAISGIAMIKDDILKAIAASARHTDESIESATTALFNKETIMQKAEMTGKFEV